MAKATVKDDSSNLNGQVRDEPCVNAAVVGVDLISGAGNVPGPEPEPPTVEAPSE
jgi:hypothetical protein